MNERYSYDYASKRNYEDNKLQLTVDTSTHSRVEGSKMNCMRADRKKWNLDDFKNEASTYFESADKDGSRGKGEGDKILYFLESIVGQDDFITISSNNEPKNAERLMRSTNSIYSKETKISESIKNSYRKSLMKRALTVTRSISIAALNNENIELYDIQCFVLEKGIMIPIDTLGSLLASADKDCDGHLSIEEINNYLNSFSSSPYEILKSLVSDMGFWLNFLYIVGGVILIVGAHHGQELPKETIANMYLVVSICYFINSGLFVFPYPLKEWKLRKEVARIKLDFVDTVIDKAMVHAFASYREQKKLGCIHSQLSLYLSNVVFRDRSELSKFEFQLFLLKEMGKSYSSRVLDDIYWSIDTNMVCMKSMINSESVQIKTST